MFETSKLPTEQRTVTGNSVSFNTHYALPLDACKISFEATQSGSGDHSPTNICPISGVSSITLGANGSATVIDLDGTRYGGYVDVVRKKLVLNRGEKILTGNENFTTGSTTSTTVVFSLLNAMNIKNESNQICSHFKFNTQAWRADAQYINCFVQGGSKTLYIQIDNTIASDATEFKQWLSDEYNNNRPVTYVCNIDNIEIDLSSIPDLSSIIGNNTFSTDTGSLEISFQDLQEKSASGAIATFNTALDMPLVNGEFTIQAYQEGSGDPSPVNVRNIVPRREVNIENYGGNDLLIGMTYEKGQYINNQGVISSSGAWSLSDYIEVTPNLSYVALKLATGGYGGYCASYKADKTLSRVFSIVANTPTYFNLQNDEYYLRLSVRSMSPKTFGSNLYLDNQYLVNLGEDTYGAVYNSVTGNKLNNCIMSLLKNISWTYVSSLGVFRSNGTYPKSRIDALCECYKPVSSGPSTINNNEINFVSQYWDNNKRIIIKDTRFTDVNAFIEAMGDYKVVFEVETPTETQLDPTPINTFNGDNNIFCDTGDIELTYKDCDIAKRGDFRQVFKIPD